MLKKGLKNKENSLFFGAKFGAKKQEKGENNMANITKKSNGTYLVRISCGSDAAGKNIIKSRIFKPSKPNLTHQKLNRELDAFVEEFEEEIAQYGVGGRPDKMRFAEFTEKYLEIKKPQLSPVTFAFYEEVIRDMLIPMFGTLRLGDIRTHHIQQFIQYLYVERPRGDGAEGHIAPATIKRYTTVMRSILTLAYKMEYIEEDVAVSRRIEFPKMDRPEVEAFSMEEVSQILEATESEPINIKLLIEIALFTGLRRGEIVGLKWDDIDLEKMTLSVKRSIYKPKDGKAQEKPPKSKNSVRTMAIPQRLCETLVEYKQHQDRHASYLGSEWQNLGYIFTEEDGYVMNPMTPTKQFSKFLARHGIRHLKLHGMRHTSATLLLANGCDIKTVSARLGHADLETTNIYLHSLESVDRLAAGMFDRILTKEKQS